MERKVFDAELMKQRPALRRASLGEELRCLLAGFTAALFPQPENRQLARTWEVDVAPYSLALGIAEAAAGGLGFFFGAIAAIMGHAAIFNMALLENWFPGLNTTHFAGGGLIALAIWCCHPLAWLLVLIACTGTLRVVAFATSREPVGEPFVWVFLRAGQFLRSRWRRRSALQRLGPLRNDRLLWNRGSDLTILSCRERPEWEENPVIELQERFFSIESSEQRREGAFEVIAYRFRELEPNEVIRRSIVYVDTATRFETAEP